MGVPPDVQRTRLMARNGFSEDEAKRRIAAQLPMDKQRALADFEISNGGTLQDLEQEVCRLVSRRPRGWTCGEVCGFYACIGAAATLVFATQGVVAGVAGLIGAIAIARRLR